MTLRFNSEIDVDERQGKRAWVRLGGCARCARLTTSGTNARKLRRSLKGKTCLLELLDGTLVDTAALVDQVAGLGIVSCSPWNLLQRLREPENLTASRKLSFGGIYSGALARVDVAVVTCQTMFFESSRHCCWMKTYPCDTG